MELHVPRATKVDRLKLPHVRMSLKHLEDKVRHTTGRGVSAQALRVKLYGSPADVEKAWLVVAKARLRQASAPGKRLLLGEARRSAGRG